MRQTLEKRVLRELGINVSFQVMIFLITWVLYLIFGTAVVAYAKLVKTPSTVVSTVIVYGDWVKSTMSLIGGAFGLVGSITYLYLIFIRSSRKGYQKSRTTKKPSSKLVRTFCGPVTAVVLTIAMLAGETVILQGGSLLVSETENPELFDRYTSNIRFKDERLEDVLRAINKESAGWQIEASSPTLGKRRLTVDFSNNSPESVAELICWTFDLKCTRQGNRLILSER